MGFGKRNGKFTQNTVHVFVRGRLTRKRPVAADGLGGGVHVVVEKAVLVKDGRKTNQSSSFFVAARCLVA